MKKILLLTLFFAAPNLFGDYKIKIAVYKDHANLMTYVAKIAEESYRKNILIEEKNHLHYVTSTLYESENEANKALSAYKKVFPDAFIVEEENKVIVPVSTEKEEKKVIVPVSTEEIAQNPELIEKEQIPSFDAKMLLENKTIYICNDGGSVGTKKEVVKLDFKKEYAVYRKLNRDTPPIQIPYTFDQDCLILMLPMSGINFKYQIYHEEEDFLSAQSFLDDKEGKRLRYYFDEELALEFTKRY